MATTWDQDSLEVDASGPNADIAVYDYYWACGHAGVRCSLPLVVTTSLPLMHAYVHHEVLSPPPQAPHLGSAMSRPSGEGAGLGEALRFRPPTEGPELRMVETFLQRGLPAPGVGERLSVMIEPKVEGVFPDIVAAYWSPDVSEAWAPARRSLIKADIRLLHFLHVHGGSIGIDDLLHRFRGLKRSLDRLIAAAVIESIGEKVTLRPLDEIFALRRLICVEAKVSAPAKALDQAVRCSWFASEVYLLIPGLPKDENLMRIAALHGIGMVLPDSSIEDAVVTAEPGRLPRSYATWMFNEWVWRLIDNPAAERERATRG